MAKDIDKAEIQAVTPEQARQVLADEQLQRQLACQAELQALLAKYRCQILVAPHLTPDGRIVASMQIMALK